ncbi:Bug family tripartite tricarboxylate transporter substrate binding protein [Ideonella livida]|uniref:Tripartite tricarboxylate transporter substrate binding protein n=1 Tax=Ideonella livida TaxID=2707176 RepID=A0A7C9PIN4_9BURK|nr:tripartite tricarboxylate transporter substrate binding protein [Ideonella livida]NDY92114.1 tripartite tricarboxylate transporter substrate binding protein [Ideonella livida]
MNRRQLHHHLLGTAATLLAAGGLPGATLAADAFPSKPITVIIASSPGSTTDGLARLFGTVVTRETGQPVIVDSRPGAMGAIAAQAAARANPDGHTLFMATNTTQAANPHLMKRLPYDPVKDFTPVGQLVQGYMLMVVHPSVEAQSVADFVALAKKQPGKLSYGEGSSSARVAVEAFQQQAGVDVVHVPYKANPQAILDLVGGQTQLMIVDYTTSLPQVKAGKLRALGVTNPTRSPLLPQVPTFAEQGLPGFEATHWNALYAPARTPAPVVARLNELLRKAVATPEARAFAENNGMVTRPSAPEELARFQAAETERWGRIIRTAGIQPE